MFRCDHHHQGAYCMMIAIAPKNVRSIFNVNFNTPLKMNSLVRQLVIKKTLITAGCTVQI